ncbi:MAG: acyltransferase family protein [Bacteroidales bacterium]
MKRNYTIDTLRTIAIMLVILLHVSSKYVISGMNNNNYDLSFWISNIVDSFSRICVPIFVLISGMFLIGRNENFAQSYKKRASRILIPIIAWSIIYLVYRATLSYVLYHTFDIMGLIKSVLLGKPFYHMWYLYMLIGLYLVTPILNNNISKISRKNLWIVSILLLVFGMFNSGYDMILNNKPIFILWFINYLGFFILGFLIKDYNNQISSKSLFIWYLISGILISILTYYTAKYFKNLYFYGYLTPFVIIGSLSVFMLFQKIHFRKNILSRISHLSLGIFLIHAGILEVFNLGLRELNIHVFEKPLLGIPIEFIVTFIISTIISYLFYKSRLLRKII